MLVANREGGDDLHRCWQRLDGCRVECITGSAHHAVAILRQPDESRAVMDLISRVEDGVEAARKPRLDGGRKQPCRQYAWFPVDHNASSLPCGVLRLDFWRWWSTLSFRRS